MSNNNIINYIHDCYGCGLCVVSCARQIIEIKLNKEGFYTPVIHSPDKCTDCGLCTQVCAYLNDDLSSPEKVRGSYAVWSTDEAVRQKCSSGGIAFELGCALLKKGYQVCGVKYNARTNRAEHYIASTVEELIPSIGSKYIQSYPVDGFKSIDRRQKYLVTGTPCQMDSFRRYIRKFRCEDNFVLMDFFCHGVPSMLLWEKYISEVERITGKITYASWRNKFTGWHDSWAMSIDGEFKGEKVNWHDSYNVLIKVKKCFYNSRLSQGDGFYGLFLSDVCLGKACYEKCKYKHGHSSADIRIGDLWGRKFRKDEKGVSGVLTFTDKGERLLHDIPLLHIESCDLKYVVEGQMKDAPVLPSIRSQVLDMLRDDRVTLQRIARLIEPVLRKRRIKKLLANPFAVVRNRLIKYFNL